MTVDRIQGLLHIIVITSYGLISESLKRMYYYGIFKGYTSEMEVEKMAHFLSIE